VYQKDPRKLLATGENPECVDIHPWGVLAPYQLVAHAVGGVRAFSLPPVSFPRRYKLKSVVPKNGRILRSPTVNSGRCEKVCETELILRLKILADKLKRQLFGVWANNLRAIYKNDTDKSGYYGYDPDNFLLQK
jgi:hypothetical protein